ncbi:MAG: hypothetical protein ACOYU3_04385 [Bacillota bacterium]
MRKKQVWAILLVCMLLTFSLTACNNGGKADVTKLDPNVLYKEFVQKYKAANSGVTEISFVLDASATVESNKTQRVFVDLNVLDHAINEPIHKEKANIKMTSDTNGQKQSLDMQMYVIEENGQLKAYYDTATSSAANKEMMEYFAIQNGQTLGSIKELEDQANKVFDYLTNPRIIGAEAVNGKETIHMQAQVDVSRITNEALASSKESMTAEQLASVRLMVRMLGDVQLDIWMDAATHDPVKVELDLGDQLNSLMEILMPIIQSQTEDTGANMNVSRIALKLTITDFNTVQDFHVPVGLKATKGTKAQS